MLVELEITKVGLQKRSSFVWLTKQITTIGSDLQSDILLLDSKNPLRMGEIHIEKNTVYWKSANSNNAPQFGNHCNIAQGIAWGSYFFRVRKVRSMIPYGMAVFISFLFTILSSKFSFFPGRQYVKDKTNSVISLPARESYGPAVDQTEKVLQFDFQIASVSSVVLHYVPGNIAELNQVQIYLNSVNIGSVPICSRHWHIEQRVVLPEKFVKSGNNLLEFLENTSKHEENSLWGIRQIYITHLENQKTYEEADVLFVSAQQLFLKKDMIPGQLVRARHLVDKAISQYKTEGKTVNPEAIKLQQDIQQQEQVFFDQMLSHARGAIRRGDGKRAKKIYDRLLEELIDPFDERRNILLEEKKKFLHE